MPMYDMLCPACEGEWEDFAKIEEKDEVRCPFCYDKGVEAFGISQITIRSKPKVHGNQMGVVDVGLGEYVGSEEDRKRIMKQNNLQEVGDAPCSTTHLNTVEKDKIRKDIDGELEYNGFPNISVESVPCEGFDSPGSY